MYRKTGINSEKGFTLVEMILSILVMGFVLIAVSGVFMLFQKGSTQTTEYADAQQNARIAVDYITDHLRQAGSSTDYFRGQRPIVHAGPYQIAMNADIDNGQVIDGQVPLEAINAAAAPNKVPASGLTIYKPAADYDSEAETIVFTLDSNADGVISNHDQGDDPEEGGLNRNLFILKKYVYGFDGAGSNEVRITNIAELRGPNLSPTWTIPQPLFQYWYDHDEDPMTADILWGDDDGNGELDTGEIVGISEMPLNLLSNIRKIRITAIAESEKYDKRYETNGGFMSITMNSEVLVRNMSRSTATIRGMVFHDLDKDGVRDMGESGIPKVEIRLAGQNRSVLTDNFGLFYFPLPAGKYSVQEIDPAGYTSTTSNLVSLTLAAGQAEIVNFGDISSNPTGVIHGTVYEDKDKDGSKGLLEPGLPGVLISLDSGEQTLTNEKGYYSFAAEAGNYIVVETDPTGFSSTTPNSYNAIIAAANDTVLVDFGDYAGLVTGTLEGYVYLDINEDGIYNSGEEGLPNVTIVMSNGDSTLTNSSGLYRFSLMPDKYSVVERDPAGYTSTTVNKYVNIPITADTVVVRNFGDMLETRQDFVEIHISNTDRVLSVSTSNMYEDEKNDEDIVLGTALDTGIGNMLVFHNNWENSATPVTELFKSDPVYRRDAGFNINSMQNYDFSGDGVNDVLSGLDVGTVNNIQLWYTGAGGVLGIVPDMSYKSASLTEVMDTKMADFDRDGNIDMLVGVKSGVGLTGAFEVFLGLGGGNFMSVQEVTMAGAADEFKLGAIWAVDAGDVDGDGDLDILVGSHVTEYMGYIDVYINLGAATGKFAWKMRYNAWGAVNDIIVLDMMEDDGKDPDIVAGITVADNAGFIMLWLNTGGSYGIPDTTGYVFGPQEVPNFPDDWVFANGEALSLGILNINNDVYPDVTYGTRSTSLYTGDIYILPAYGTLPTEGTMINTSQIGEIISIDVADFNKDAIPDIVVGTRSSATQGKLVAFFGRRI